MKEPSDERSLESAIGRARMLLDRRRVDEARDLIASALRSFPEHPDLLHLAGYVEFLDENNDRAREVLEQVLAVDPEHEGARVVLYQVYRDDRRFAEAEQVLLSLIRDAPRDSDYYAWYALLMIATGHFDKALKLGDEAVRLDPENEDALIASTTCAVVLLRGSEPRGRVSELVRQYPESASTLAMLAAALAEQGKAREALQIAQELLLADPSDEDRIEMCVELRIATHWSMLPLWPMVRYGWLGSAAVWVVFVAYAVFAVPHLSEPLALACLAVILAYVVYSWVYPGILRRLLSR